MTARLEGKVALVTGASRGLGRAIALRFARDGARVAVHYHTSKEGAAETVRSIQESGGVACVVQADATKRESVRRAVDETVRQFGGLHILVNNIGQHRRANSLEQSQEDWEDLVARNLSSAYYFCQSVAAHLKGHGGGQIVNISSKMAMSTAPSNAAYCAAKAGLVALTQVLACEWARFGIRVNCVAPGVMATEATEEMTQSLDATGLLERCLLARTPVGRLGEVGEVAAVVAFLASGESDFLTGATLLVDGGWTAYGDYIGWGIARSLTQAPGSRR